MKLTRRQFAQSVGSTFALTVLGCSDDADSTATGGYGRGKLVLPDKPFRVGHPNKYRNVGVYDDYRRSHGIWLVSNGNNLVALSAVCTHNGCGTRFDSMSQVFKCPCHSSTFTTDGINRSGSRAERPLERCMITLKGDPDDPEAELEVNPNKLYRQDDTNPISGRNWSSPYCIYIFEQ